MRGLQHVASSYVLGTLYGRVRVTLRQYDTMREAENSFILQEEWPSRWRLRQLRKHMLKSAIPLRRETTTRQLPVGKGRALRKLPDAVCGGNPLTGEARPPGMSRGRVVNSHATPP